VAIAFGVAWPSTLKRMSKHCCESMRRNTEFSCEQHASPFDCPDALVSYSTRFNEYGLIVHDGGTSSILISFCPWCGVKLPASLRQRWFLELESLGFDDPWTQDIPERFKTDGWYRAV
jgi:hypothetical protein